MKNQVGQESFVLRQGARQLVRSKDNLSLHEFPKENVRPNIRRQWIKFVQVKRKDFIKPTANSVLCEKHFPHLMLFLYKAKGHLLTNLR
jgi:hypothetical protein